VAIYRVTFSGIYLGSVMQNVVHFEGSEGTGSLATIAVDMRDNWAVTMRNAHCSGFAYTNIAVKNLSDPSEQTYNLPYAAAGSGEPTPPHMVIAFILTLRGAAPGRRGRGRVYVAAPRGGWIANSVVTSAGLTSLQSLVINPISLRFVSPGNTSSLKLVIYHKNWADGPDVTSVASISARQYLGVQRRRNINVGV